ncbi:hypothetical protein [Methylobacterium iners]|uniref:Cell division protein FtsK n=1 Tax=Methylobacterium iners TaxID=418707 RepID=A0ABQ4RV74_9HYPH|nr:hypothetical protein [Methylobacterium iners]GJD93573.1 hypothetical protein OCOJLMKI_0769 [Methylobacterium iners]
MLVYGETTRTHDPHERLDGLAQTLRRAAAEPGGILRHESLVCALIEAGELLQGIADADRAEMGRDALSPSQAAATALLMQIAHAVLDSWQRGFEGDVPTMAESLSALAAMPLPSRITTKWAEGFTFYALYPESYALAAARSGLPPETQVVGIRSIGAPLGAIVAAGLGAAPPVTVRPGGHPFRREIGLDAVLSARLAGAKAAGAAIVDEGPGLSGSSFGAVADRLEGLGVPEHRIALFPSHAGSPGPQASERHRDRWGRLARHLVPFEAIVLDPERGLTAWAEDLIGSLDGPVEEISGGGWRHRHYAGEADWPPVNAQGERRKFLLRAQGETWLARFAGLGRAGADKLDRATSLHAAGFGPPVAGYRHGFLIERWIDGALPLDRRPADPDRLVDTLGRYLGFRARTFPSGPGRGASLADLLAMARHNTAESLGPDAARAFDRWNPEQVEALQRRSHPVAVDGRLQSWEWLVLPDGRLLKSDALDHHAGHDLVGCQDIAWDVAGACEELDLSPEARGDVQARVAREAGSPVDANLLELLTPCYLAFQLGAWTMAAGAATDPAEAGRIDRLVRRHARRLARVLAEGASR